MEFHFKNQTVRGMLSLIVAVAVSATQASIASPPDAEKRGNQQPPHPSRPLVAISARTTYITEPLRTDGYPDYLAALNRLASKGVTLENNAAVLLMQQVFRPEYFKFIWGTSWSTDTSERYSDAERSAIFRGMGIAPPPNKGDYFVDYFEYVHIDVRTTLDFDNKDVASHFEQYDQATHRPWSKKEFPLLAEWLAANESPLSRITEASRRPRFFVPFTFRKWRDGGIACAIASPMRDAVEALQSRAMLELSEGKATQAWSDLQTCHRLATLLGQVPTYGQRGSAYILELRACYSDWQFAYGAGLTLDQAKKYRTAMHALPSWPSTTKEVLVAARLGYLNAICDLARGEAKLDHAFRQVEKAEKALMDLTNANVVDWNQVLRSGNDYFDAVEIAAHKPTWAEQYAAIAALEKKLGDTSSRYRRALAESPAEWRNVPPEARASWLAQRVSALSLDAFRRMFDGGPSVFLIFNRNAGIMLDLTEIALMLGAYCTEHGEYPDKLDMLAPRYFDRLPQDPYADDAYKYQRKGKGFVLYSVGVDGKDEGGPGQSNLNDDIGVCIPSCPGHW